MEEAIKCEDFYETKCTIHSDKNLEYFCEKCKIFGCEECKTINHPFCYEVKNIMDMLKDLTIDDKVKEIADCLNVLSLELEYCRNTIDSNRLVESKLQKSAMEKFRHQMKEIRKTFDNLEKVTEEKINAIGKDNLTKLDKALTEQEKLKNKLSNIKADLEVKHINKIRNDPKEIFIAVKAFETKTNQEMKSEIEDLKQYTKIERYEYEPSKEVIGILENLKFGKIEIKTLEQKKGFIFCLPLDVFRDDTNKHSIPALVIVNEKFLVAWDRTARAVLALDTSNCCITSKLEGLFLTSFTRINDNQLAVSMPDKNTIQFLNLSQSGILSLGHKIAIKDKTFEPYGIQFCNDALIAACHTEVRILDMEGKGIRTIDTNSIGENMFNAAFCVVVSPDKETIYILDYFSDHNCSSVTSLTLDGKVKAIYKDKDLIKPHAMSIDRNGSVFVHCQGTNNVHMMSADCRKAQTMSLPSHCFAFSTKSNKVYIGTEHGIDKYITN